MRKLSSEKKKSETLTSKVVECHLKQRIPECQCRNFEGRVCDEDKLARKPRLEC